MDRSAVIIAGGTLNIKFALAYLKQHRFDCYIAVDNGLAYMEQLGLIPDVMVGDFDTASDKLVNRYKELQNITLIELKAEKDETDMESAIDYSIRMGYNKVVLLAAMGGRFDHTLANLHMLYRLLQQGIQGRMVDEYNCIYLLNRSQTVKKDELYGRYISLLPYTSEVNHLTLEGFKYPLNNYCLRAGSSIGISNEAVKSECNITFHEGILIVVEAQD